MQKHLLTAMAALCIAFATAQPTTNGLVAYWPLNGNFTDAGPNNLTTTNTNVAAAANSAGTANTAMFFSNTISIPPTLPVPATSFGAVTINAPMANINFSNTANFTVAHWFRISNAGSGGHGFFDNCMNYGGYATWAWRLGTAGNPIQVHFNAGNVSVSSPVATSTINLNTWYHLAGVKDGGTLRMYINGLQVATVTPSGGFSVPGYTHQPKFGTLWFNTPGYYNYAPFNGNLDEMRLYNRALTPAEISVLASSIGAGTLPVKLSSFTATKNSGAVNLKWQTEYEQNSSHFNIQRSTDGVNFTTIGTVQAKGTVSTATDYNFADNAIATLNGAKTIYYRLQQADRDGRSELSSIVTVRNETIDGLLTVLQNPTINELRLQIAVKQQQPVQLNITNAQGQQLSTKQLTLQQGQTFTALPINKLAAGTYYVTVTAGTQKQTLSFIKQ